MALERAIAEYLRAGQGHSACAIWLGQAQSHRVGNTWRHLPQIHHDALTSNGSPTALVVLVDALVVDALAGGSPKNEQQQIGRNPLGPAPGIGEVLRPSVA